MKKIFFFSDSKINTPEIHLKFSQLGQESPVLGLLSPF